MKIENSAVQLGGLTATDPALQNGVRGGHKHAHGADHVELSRFAQAFGGDTARIDQLKAAYEAGKYNVSPHLIAASMINYSFAA